MKKIFLIAFVVLVSVFNANAQVRIESPHPDLDVKITKCTSVSGNVLVDMIITNYGAEEEITFAAYSHGNSAAYDDDGNIYESNEFRCKIGSGKLYSYARTIFPTDIPLKVSMQINGISSNATKLLLIKLEVNSNGSMSLNNKKPIVIRNIEWVK